MFINQNNAGVGTVSRYSLFTNFTDAAHPVVNIDAKVAPLVVYTGGAITGITINELLGLLVIADGKGKSITAYEYDDAVLKKLNKTAPYSQVLVQNSVQASNL